MTPTRTARRDGTWRGIAHQVMVWEVLPTIEQAVRAVQGERHTVFVDDIQVGSEHAATVTL